MPNGVCHMTTNKCESECESVLSRGGNVFSAIQEALQLFRKGVSH